MYCCASQKGPRKGAKLRSKTQELRSTISSGIMIGVLVCSEALHNVTFYWRVRCTKLSFFLAFFLKSDFFHSTQCISINFKSSVSLAVTGWWPPCIFLTNLWVTFSTYFLRFRWDFTFSATAEDIFRTHATTFRTLNLILLFSGIWIVHPFLLE